jgi:hypothetical protein
MSYIIYDSDKKNNRNVLCAFDGKPDKSKIVEYMRDKHGEGVYFAEWESRKRGKDGKNLVEFEKIVVPPDLSGKKTQKNEGMPVNQDQSATFRGIMPDLSHIESQIKAFDSRLDRLQRTLDEMTAGNERRYQDLHATMSSTSHDIDELGELIGEIHEKMIPMSATVAEGAEMAKKFGPTIMGKVLGI